MNETAPTAFPCHAVMTPAVQEREDQPTSVWQQVQSKLRECVPESTYATWFDALSPVSLTDGIFRIATPNRFVHNWIIEHYQDQISQALHHSLGVPCQVDFVVAETADAPATSVGKQPRLAPHHPTANHQSVFNPDFTFDRFVVGPSNAFAHAACLAVAQHPTQAYNPLFIYGDVGLGKTHLLHAMGNHLAKHAPHLTACYVSSEIFLNDLVGALSASKMDAFRSHYRQCDIILVDDVQFLADKERTQEELFHTFNVLHNDHKQIIFTSDQPPNAMQGFEMRLKSRFEWGLVTDLQTPSLETKVEILKVKAIDRQLDLSDEVTHLIAQRMRGDVRKLEGTLNIIEAYTEMMGQPLTVNLALTLIGDLATSAPKPLGIDDIQLTVTEHYNLSPTALRSPKRTQQVVHARHIAMYIARTQTQASLPQIGKAFGNRDHSSVVHACNKVQDLIQSERQVKEEIAEILRQLQG